MALNLHTTRFHSITLHVFCMANSPSHTCLHIRLKPIKPLNYFFFFVFWRIHHLNCRSKCAQRHRLTKLQTLNSNKTLTNCRHRGCRRCIATGRCLPCLSFAAFHCHQSHILHYCPIIFARQSLTNGSRSLLPFAVKTAAAETVVAVDRIANHTE